MRTRKIWAVASPQAPSLQILKSHYDNVQVCPDPTTQDLEVIAKTAHALLLDTDITQACTIAQAVRKKSKKILILAQMAHPRLSERTALLRSGVNMALPPEDDPVALTAVLNAIWIGRAPGSKKMQIGDWKLENHGWLIIHKDTIGMRLTLSERALVLCLFEAAGNIATHAQLKHALAEARKHTRTRKAADPSIRHIFSRLKQRAEEYGLDVNVESISGYGYAWI